MVSLAEKRRGAEHLEAEHGASERRACQVIEIARSSKRRPSGRIEEAKLVRRMHELTAQYPRFGYRKIFTRLQGEGFALGRERLRLLRKREGLRVPQKQRKRRRKGNSTADVDRALYPNHVWSYDFVADRIQEWIKDRPTDTYFIEPGSPWQNGHNESFNGVLRDGCLNRWAFMSVGEARLVVESWRSEYNDERPHGALNQMTPAAYAARMALEHGTAA
ncbi:MAG: transposase [Proteobacteria bacterium]|nr:transposase [Pseudomonadota bacterium]